MISILKRLIGVLSSNRRRSRENAIRDSLALRGTLCRPREECLKERLRTGSVSTTTHFPSHWERANWLLLYDPYSALSSGPYRAGSEKSGAS